VGLPLSVAFASAGYNVIRIDTNRDPGNRRFAIENTPKVVGGEDADSTALAVCALEQVITNR
jgi:UDP-N-acetyl-D-mannosaminuronate dehydrogenase